MKKERWIPIPEYENLYEISDLGRVKSLERVVHLPRGGFRTDPEKVMRNKMNRLGYPLITLSKNGKYKTFKIHRLVMAAFMGPSDKQVNHINFRKDDNRLSNLEYVSVQENFDHSRHRHFKNTPRGERHANSKLTDKQRKEISKLRGKYTCTYLAKKYGVHHSIISRIWRTYACAACQN